MSNLQNLIAEHRASIERLTSAISNYSLNEKPAQVMRRMSDTEKLLFGWVYKQPGMPQLHDCHKLYLRVKTERSEEDADALLKRFGLKYQGDLSSMFAGMWQPFCEYASTVLLYGISPMYGIGSEDDLKDAANPRYELRDRWLLYHEPDDSLFVVRGKLTHTLNDELTDVTGVQIYEQRYEKDEQL